MCNFRVASIFTFTIALIITCGQSKSLSENKHAFPRVLGQGQLEQKFFLDSILDGKHQLSEPFEYNTHFRPPSSDESAPTRVNVTLKELVVKSINVTKGKEAAIVEAIFGMEYQDSRLKFKFPPGSTKTFIRAMYGRFDPLNIWHPDFGIEGDRDQINHGSNDDATLFNPEGLVYDRRWIGVDPTFIGCEKNAALVFSVRITGKWDPVEDLEFVWDTKKPISLTSSSVKPFDTHIEYDITTKEETCRKPKIVDFGPMGEHKFSCIELLIMLTPRHDHNDA